MNRIRVRARVRAKAMVRGRVKQLIPIVFLSKSLPN